METPDVDVVPKRFPSRVSTRRLGSVRAEKPELAEVSGGVDEEVGVAVDAEADVSVC